MGELGIASVFKRCCAIYSGCGNNYYIMQSTGIEHTLEYGMDG